MIDRPRQTLQSLAVALASSATTSRALVEKSLERIGDPVGEGALSFLTVDKSSALAEADRQDNLRASGNQPSPYAGIPFSAKDLFDIAGQVTTAGSKLLQNAPAALSDAPAIAALKAAGFVLLGRTNMTEFAYSGVGLNPHYGTPASNYDRKIRRIPGGSSSGAAVAVADGMCALSIGSDTGGSTRIPAAYNGIVGYKPSTGRVSTQGAYPLSKTFDSIGPMANSVACCAIADAIMAGDWDGLIAPRASKDLKLAVLMNHAMVGLDAAVANDLAHALDAMRRAGARITLIEMPELAELPSLMVNGGIVAAEAFMQHQSQIEAMGDAYDPRVVNRIRTAGGITAQEYQFILVRRAAMIATFNRLSADYDAVVLPTVPIISPAMSVLADDGMYMQYNGLSLRNTYLANFLNGCSISLPMNKVGAAPTGLMLMASHSADEALFAAAAAVERILG